uniref:Uncharacterized protein n=1 Tax=Arundo donax TaxID=35708 RepID=A0A0A9CYL3_ARUDO
MEHIYLLTNSFCSLHQGTTETFSVCLSDPQPHILSIIGSLGAAPGPVLRGLSGCPARLALQVVEDQCARRTEAVFRQSQICTQGHVFSST